MSGEKGSFKGAYFDIVGGASVPTPASGALRLWANSNDSNNFYAKDEAGNEIQITSGGSLVTGNAQYLWDWFYNQTGVTIPNYSVVRLVSTGPLDGTLALSDNDVTTADTFLGIVWGGAIAHGSQGKVIYSGKVPGAVTGLGLPSMTTIYMSNVPGQFTASAPNFLVSSIFILGFTKGNDLYLRPENPSDL